MKRLFITLGVVVMISGCGGPSEGSPGAADPRFSALIQDALADAQAGSSGEDQIAILRRIESTGTATYADFLEAVNATFECFTAANIGYESIPGPSNDLEGSIYYAYVSTPETDPVAEACIVEHSWWVELVYQGRPEAVEAQEARFERAIPSLVACLEEVGYVLPPDPTSDQVKDALMSASIDEESGLTPVGWSVIGCYEMAGV